MPEQSTSTATRRPDLGVMAWEMIEEASGGGFVWPILFPIIRVPFKAQTFGVIPIEAWMKNFDTSRSPKATYHSADYKTESGKYSCTERGWVEYLDDGERALYDSMSPGFAEKMAVMRGNTIINRREEVRAAAIVAALANHAVSIPWSTYATATPINDVKDGKAAFRAACGMNPNALLISETCFENLRICSQIRDQVKYTFPGIDIQNMTPAQVAQCLGIPRLVIAGAMYDTSAENVAFSLSDIWDSTLGTLLRLPANAMNLEEPCLGHTFLWTEDSPEVPVVEQYREEDRRSDAYRCRMNMDMKVMQSEADDGTAVSTIYTQVSYQLSSL